ncbi:transcriptional regulator, AraC family [Rhodococcus wratislaviensis]|uniref:Transcriptional regulator, AraC family n=1 Tax=Rhodococcus wratislaviensis TaxID=44752 RepID=A0A402C002_RHOWR|nr:transcriptional regulator, AraC family [Rhodococcus wratislaviensis]
MSALHLGPLHIVRINWGADVAVHSEHPGAVGINIPLHGELETRIRGRLVVSGPGFATVNPADTPADITRWPGACTILGVKIDRDFVQRELWRVTGRADAVIPDQIDLSRPAAASWFRLLSSIVDQPVDDALLANPHVAQGLAASLTDGFLLAAVPDETDDRHAVRPRIVTRVIDAINAEPDRLWTAADMADVAGVSVRRLQEGFRIYLGKTPRECLTEIRLAGVRAELASGSARSVTDVALKWGFTHYGRFAAAFRQRYGVPPSSLLH